MASATFEDHPTDPNKVILRKKPHLDKGRDYEEGFIDGMQHQMQSSVDKAVNAMTDCPTCEYHKQRAQLWRDEAYRLAGHPLPERKKEWVGLTDEEITELHYEIKVRLMGTYKTEDIYRAIEAKLKEKNA